MEIFHVLQPTPVAPFTPAPTTNVDLTDGDMYLNVDISDALSERDWVKFTVHTKTNMSEFAKAEFSVIRLHEEFIWLHDTFNENPDYAGFIIPPPPPRPDFDASKEKLRKLGDAEGNLTKEEFNKMKQELEAEYLATFKKTVNQLALTKILTPKREMLFIFRLQCMRSSCVVLRPTRCSKVIGICKSFWSTKRT